MLMLVSVNFLPVCHALMLICEPFVGDTPLHTLAETRYVSSFCKQTTENLKTC